MHELYSTPCTCSDGDLCGKGVDEESVKNGAPGLCIRNSTPGPLAPYSKYATAALGRSRMVTTTRVVVSSSPLDGQLPSKLCEASPPMRRNA